MKKLFLVLLLLAFGFQACQNETVEPLARESSSSGAPVPKIATGVSYELHNWMSALNGNLKLSELSIPGTHDSGARYDHPLLSGSAKCQDLTIGEQLEAGTRFLDIRCRHIGDAFTIHHGVVYQHMNFTDVLNYCFNFLNANPTESIVMSIKEEHEPENNTRSFEATLESYLQANPDKWYLAENVPALEQVRGKIVLLRRFSANNTPKGINATAWQDNTTFEINTPQALLKVQDVYQVPDNNQKWNSIESLLNEAKTGNADRLYINFTSGYKPGWFGIPNIPTVSDAINPKVSNYFSTPAKGRFGIIPMDFAEASRNARIVEANF
ncbi:phosphatidylinositol-specific phospholipase C [Rapidithrix thailandica]|uniref:1-phosphatidylinositol phosphodiesterase n=1 Tax=Rapidithrix thailandica TaxID=413964 RepID=A0AAW9S5V0_9BACT